jgi:hypothetical protein
MSVVGDGHDDDATEVTDASGGSRNLPDPVIFVAVVLAFAGAVTARIARRDVALAHDEHVLFRARPRRDLFRYLLSLGLWEVPRRSTQFLVTERRVIVDRGLLVRHTRSIPLRQISAVDVVQTPWEHDVEINGGTGGLGSLRLGPLSARSARHLTAAVAAAIAARRH